MTQILWNENIPSGQSAVGTAPAYLRSVWTSISLGLGTSLYWDGVGGASQASRGEFKPGAARTFIGVQSLSSAPNSQSTGKMFFASDTSRLLMYDSTTTILVGTPFLMEYGSTASSNGVASDTFVECSGTTVVSNITSAAASTITVLTLNNFLSAHTRPLAAFVIPSVGSVLARASIHRTISPQLGSLRIDYIGTLNCPTTATLMWQVIVPTTL